MKQCPCGSTRIAPSNLASGYLRCAKCIYRRSAAAAARYRRSAKARVCRQRYDKTDKGRARRNRANAKRIEIGDTTIYAKTLQQRDDIRALIRRRLEEFKQRQHVTE
jgi:DNA-directed RNA polymerase subunit M/transcription elongation factor TFIIS